MLDIAQDIQSLSNFKRNTSDVLHQLRETGRPVVLTVNGKAEMVVQDAQSYQKMLTLIDRMETLAAIQEGLADVDAGRTQTLAEFDQETRRDYGLPG